MTLAALLLLCIGVGAVAGKVFGHLVLAGIEHARRARARKAWADAWAAPR